MEIKVYIVNLGKYTEGARNGEWFTLPVDLEDVKTKLGLVGDYEEYTIHDFEAPFKISEFESLDNLNKIAVLFEEHAGNSALKYCGEIMDEIGYTISDFFDSIDSVIVYEECHLWSDYARYIVYKGDLGDLTDKVKGYIDYTSLGRDLSFGTGVFQAGDGTIIQYE